jgi:GAF domain-containing protein
VVLGGTPIGDAIARIRTLVRGSDRSPTRDLVAEALELLATVTGADRVVLASIDGDVASVVGAAPLDLRSARAELDCPARWYPWGLGAVRTEQSLFVRDAATLPAGPEGDVRLGDLGVHSAAWLPVREHGRTIGSLTLCWASPRRGWDESTGPIVRNVARMLLGRLDTDRRARDQDWSSTPADPAAPSVGSGRG